MWNSNATGSPKLSAEPAAQGSGSLAGPSESIRQPNLPIVPAADRAGSRLSRPPHGLAGFRERFGVDAGAIDSARWRCEEGQVVEQVAFDVRPGGIVDQTDRLGRAKQYVFGLRPDRVVPEPAIAREHGQTPALGLEEREEVGALVVGGDGQAAPGEAFGRLRAEDHVHVLVAGSPEGRPVHEVTGQT